MTITAKLKTAAIAGLTALFAAALPAFAHPSGEEGEGHIQPEVVNGDTYFQVMQLRAAGCTSDGQLVEFSLGVQPSRNDMGKRGLGMDDIGAMYDAFESHMKTAVQSVAAQFDVAAFRQKNETCGLGDEKICDAAKPALQGFLDETAAQEHIKLKVYAPWQRYENFTLFGISDAPGCKLQR